MSLRGTKRSSTDTVEQPSRTTQPPPLISDKGYHFVLFVKQNCSKRVRITKENERKVAASKIAFLLNLNRNVRFFLQDITSFYDQIRPRFSKLVIASGKKINRVSFNAIIGYSCSCPPFECMCTLQTNVPSYSQSHHHQTAVYSQQFPLADSPYWLQDAPPQENTVGYCLPNQVPQEASYGDFPPFAGDLFQPEEIFQLDQPLRPDFPSNSQEVARSPPTLLDLGSGTIKYEVKQQSQDQNYWNQFLSEDSSSSHLSLPQDDRLHFASFESEKVSNGFSSRRVMHQYVQDKNQNQPLNDTLNYQSYSRQQGQKGYIEGNAKDEQSYWPQNQQDNRLQTLEGFEVKEEDLLSARREVECYKNNSQPPMVDRTEYNLYQRPKSEDLQDTARHNCSPENKPYPFDGYHQMFEHGDVKNQPQNRAVCQSSTRTTNLDDKLQGGYGNHHESSEIAGRLYHNNSGAVETSFQSQNSPEPFFYPSNDRCHYTCEILERVPQIMNTGPVHGAVNSYGSDQTTTAAAAAADLELPPFVDYTLVGMLCSSADEDTSSLLPGCPQDSHSSYIPHH